MSREQLEHLAFPERKEPQVTRVSREKGENRSVNNIKILLLNVNFNVFLHFENANIIQYTCMKRLYSMVIKKLYKNVKCSQFECPYCNDS